MFQYNRFWHFWSQVNNRHFSRAFWFSLFAALPLIAGAVFFPPLAAVIVAIPFLVISVMAIFKQFSNFFYNRQNQKLAEIKAETQDDALKGEIDLYLNRRAICPQSLLDGQHIILPQETAKMSNAVAMAPLLLSKEQTLTFRQASTGLPQRNAGFQVRGETDQLYVKEIQAEDGLSEVAAREMAEILGFKDLIPNNTLATKEALPAVGKPTPSKGFIRSQETIQSYIDGENDKRDENNKIKNTPAVQAAVAKFIFNLKTAVYRNKVQQGQKIQLLHAQKLVPDAIDGAALVSQMSGFSRDVAVKFIEAQSRGEPIMEPQPDPSEQKKAIETIKKINFKSFQKNFLLQLILGSQDANPGNTLLSDTSEGIFLHSIDHERIMPEDNYNVTKKIPFAIPGENGAQPELEVENLFPIRLWLAGLPQANLPFTRDLIEEMLNSLCPQRLLAYHQQKKLYSAKAIGAQLDRILLIKNCFEEEMKKSEISLTPKALFLKLINNHPTYTFLKEESGLSDLHTFMLLGQIPEAADLSLLRHPLEYFPIIKAQVKMTLNMMNGEDPMTRTDFESSAVRNLLFFSQVEIVKHETLGMAPILEEAEQAVCPSP